MVVVYGRHHDGVHLDGDAPGLQPFDGAQLPVQEQFRTPESPIDDLLVPNPTVYVLPDFGIDGIDGYGHMGNAYLPDGVHMVHQPEPVGRQAADEERGE